MTGHRSWSADRRARLADPQIARAAEKARAELDRREEDYLRTLSQLRNARRLTQVQLAAILGVSQAQVSRVENQADLYLSTLRSYVKAMGGELELRAVFPDGQAAGDTGSAPRGAPMSSMLSALAIILATWHGTFTCAFTPRRRPRPGPLRQRNHRDQADRRHVMGFIE